MTTRMSGTRRRVAAALAASAVLLSGCGFSGLYNVSLPGGADTGDHPYTVTAYFTDVLDLVPQSAVKVDDAAVGKVTHIDLATCAHPGNLPATVWCAKVQVEVNGSVKLPINAQAAIEQTSLLGEKYVDLIDPRGHGAPVTCPCLGQKGQTSTIPLYDPQTNQLLTTSAPEAEDVLGALALLLNGGGLNQIQVIAKELNAALDPKSRQSATKDLIAQLNVFTGTLDSQVDKITTSLTNLDTLAVTLKKQQTLINESLGTFPAALRALSQERTKLVTLLTSLSNLGSTATKVINATQTTLVAALKSLDPVVTKLAQTGSDLPKALRIAGTFPFPLGLTRKIIKGDYANLDAYVKLDLGDVLCQTGVQALCDLGKSLPLSAKQTQLSMKTDNKTRLTPTLVGSRP